jgi:hypothetical protein
MRIPLLLKSGNVDALASKIVELGAGPPENRGG